MIFGMGMSESGWIIGGRSTIELSTGAILDKSFAKNDFVTRTIGKRTMLLETFNPCYCCKTKCKRVTYKLCIDEYECLWKEWLNELP